MTGLCGEVRVGLVGVRELTGEILFAYALLIGEAGAVFGLLTAEDPLLFRLACLTSGDTTRAAGDACCE